MRKTLIFYLCLYVDVYITDISDCVVRLCRYVPSAN